MMANDADYSRGDEQVARNREDNGDDEPQQPQKKTWFGNYMDDLTNENEEFKHAPKLLPWRIGFFLLMTGIHQNMIYDIPTYMSTNLYTTMTAKEQSQFSSLVYNMLYLGPVFGLSIDLIRVFRERYRPVIIVACLIQAIVGFVCFATKDINLKYGACLMLSWLTEVLSMYIYIPMNAVVINYGNRVLESPTETSARVGGLMSQAMVYRTAGTLIYYIFFEFAYGKSTKPYVPMRWWCLIAAIMSLWLVVQVIFLTKRSYYTDFRKISVMNSQAVGLYRDGLNVNKRATSVKREAAGHKFMFILCFTFIYFLLPDPLYNTVYTFNSQHNVGFSLGLTQASVILSQVGAVLGALAYALWMYFAERLETKRGAIFRAVPFVIVTVGCLVWIFGIFFHFIGYMGSNNDSFSYKVFLPFQNIVVGFTLRFSFMPSLSLAAMHAPRFFEATAFQLYSVCTSGGGLIAYPITSYFMSSLGVTVTKGYWKALLLFMVFRLIPMLPGASLPKYREDETIPIAKGDHEPMDEMESDADEKKDTKRNESEPAYYREEK